MLSDFQTKVNKKKGKKSGFFGRPVFLHDVGRDQENKSDRQVACRFVEGFYPWQMLLRIHRNVAHQDKLESYKGVK
jgi:hypothetical protein